MCPATQLQEGQRPGTASPRPTMWRWSTKAAVVVWCGRRGNGSNAPVRVTGGSSACLAVCRGWPTERAWARSWRNGHPFHSWGPTHQRVSFRNELRRVPLLRMTPENPFASSFLQVTSSGAFLAQSASSWQSTHEGRVFHAQTSQRPMLGRGHYELVSQLSWPSWCFAPLVTFTRVHVRDNLVP